MKCHFLKHNVYVLSLLTLITLLCYGNVITGPFLFDDQLNIELNTHIRSFSSFFDIFSSSSVAGSYIEGSNFFRPIKTFIYTLLFHFFELNPIPYHLTSIGIHILNAFFIILLLKQLSIHHLPAFFMGLLFCVHPVHIEAVSYISGIADPLGLCFILLGLRYFIKTVSTPHWKATLLSFIYFILALLSKENMIVFFLLTLSVGLYLYPNHKNSRALIVSLCSGYTLIGVSYLILKLTVLDFTGNTGLTPYQNIYTNSLLVRLNTFVHILWDYAVLLCYPKHLYLEKPYTAYVDFITWRSMFGYIMILLSVLVSWTSLKNKKGYFLGISWFFIGLGPVTGIIPLNAMYLEHWLYLPFVGLLIIVGYLLNHLRNSRKEMIIYTLLICVITSLGIRTIMRNNEWKSPLKFYKNELNYAPKNARIHNNIAMEYSDINNNEKAIFHYQEALKINPSHPEIHHNLGLHYLASGELTKAINHFKNAITISPNFIYSYYELFMLYKKMGKKEQANFYYKEMKKRQ